MTEGQGETMLTNKSGRRPLKTRTAGWAVGLARALTGVGVNPNHVSLLSVFFAILAACGLTGSNFAESAVVAALSLVAAAVCIQLRLLCNMLDGMLAIEGGRKSALGEIYNELPDRFDDLLIIGGAGYTVGAAALQPQLAWITAGLAVVTAYVRAIGVVAGASSQFAGPMAKPHRMALLTGACLLEAGVLVATGKPGSIILWALSLMAIGCVVTIIRRTLRIARELEAP
jgi:phosphatidylglycerophosphate synthase